MQTIYKNKNKKSCNGRTDLIDIVIYIGRLSRYVEREYIREFGNKSIGI